MKIHISGVNVNNEELLTLISGQYGFQGVCQNHCDTTATMDIGTIGSCVHAGISIDEIHCMIGHFVVQGFTVSVDCED